MKLSEYSVTRPIAVLMATASVFVLGILSLQRLPLTQMPEMTSSNLRVSVNYPSSAPAEVERNVTRPLEEVLSTLNNLERLESTSSNSGSNVRIEFRDGTDMDLAALEVRDRIDQVRSRLPDDIDRISIRRWQSTDMPVYRFSVAWRGSRDELYQITEETLRRRLERIDGVANIEVRGVEARQVLIELDADRLEAHGVDLRALSQALRESNVNLSGGYVLDGPQKFSLRSVGEFQSIEEIADLPIQGGRLLLKDVADVRFDFPERAFYSRLNSEEAVDIRVYKTSNANVVAVCRAVEKDLRAIEELPQFAGGLTFLTYRNQSEQILQSLDDLKWAGIWGGLLAMIVLFFFLRKIRSMLVISVAIPVSIIFTFAFMFLLRIGAGSGITINVVSLMGLMVAVGMLVDNSVVVLENIFRHRQDKGLPAKEAAIRGSKEVGVAVLAATATTVCVFSSFLFIPNAATGRFTGDFGITVAVALIASLVVAVTLVPMLSSRLFVGKQKPKQGAIVALTNAYGWLMGGLLRFRFVVLILMALIGYSSYYLFHSIDREMLPGVADRRVAIDILVERSHPPEEMHAVFERLEKLLLKRKEEFEIVAISSSYNNRTTSRGQYRGDLTLYLTDQGDLTPTLTLRERIMAALPDIPGVEFQPGRMRMWGGGSEMGTSVELTGDNPAILSLYAEEIKSRIEQIPDVQFVQTTLESGDDEIHLSIDRFRAEMLGISSLSVAQTVASALSTRATTRYKTDLGEADVILQLEGGNQVTISELLNMSLETRDGEMLPLHSLVRYEFRKGPLAIRKDDRKATITISAETGGRGTFFVSQQIQQVVSEVSLPPGYSWQMGRDWRRAVQSEEENNFAILFAILLMYLVMAALFESFVQPLTILCTVPFSIIGVAILFYLTGTTLNQMAYLGILVLFGLVVNNGILLVDHINGLRRDGMRRRDAIIQGGKDRLRPILMTACTSLFGLMPLCLPFIFPGWFGSVEGAAGMWAPVSLAVLGGLTTSTFLTLIILPSFYSYMDDLSSILKRLVAWTSTVGLRSRKSAA
ncbi:MAG TPA: efflux RND transporter permease subunit [Acidobacteriota bacterium]|nr:efflux RND transporter permease subunit [Acidobacteriota bacterium]